jgi:Protein of unknown function (DUF2637)
MTAAVTAETEAQSRSCWGDRWIRWTTTGSVVLLAAIAAMVSYRHMHTLTLAHGESAWTAALIPLSVDGMIIASSMTLLADSRTGGPGGRLPWALLAVGSAASLLANMAVAEPTVYGRVIAAWPSFALIGAYELLMRQIRGAANRLAVDSRAGTAQAAEKASGRPVDRPVPASDGASGESGRVGVRSAGGRRRPRRFDADLLARAHRLDADHRARYDRPASAETLRVQLQVGASSARALKDLLRGRVADGRDATGGRPLGRAALAAGS